MYLITNGKIITEETLLVGYELLIDDGKIAQLAPEGELERQPGLQVIDARGGYVSPGFIDIHSDYIEHMAAPRPTCLMDFRMSLREAEREMLSHGITTIFHSLSLFKSVEYKPKPIRSGENVRKLIDLIEQTDLEQYLIRHCFHARFEVDNVSEVETLKEFIASNKVHLVSFMDHTPGQGQYRDLEMFRSIIKSYDNFNDQQVDHMITELQSKPKLTLSGLREIAELALNKGLAIASHDDDSLAKLELVRGLGTSISEFPLSLEIARAARELGMFTMAGAPNILLGGSHNGNLSAAEAIQEGTIDILCSDYYPPSLLHAVFQLHWEHGLDLVELIKLVSLNPAAAVKRDQELGSIREGKTADLLVIELLETNFPVITKTFVAGNLNQCTSYQELERRAG
ncbi:MAG: phosphonate metabolism protein PhnM [Desulfitobacterium sp.]